MNIYSDVLNPVEIHNGLYIFSAILDKNRIRLLLFNNNNSFFQHDNKLYCNFDGRKKYRTIASIKKYSYVHEKYYNLICELLNYSSKNNILFISNKRINYFNNYKTTQKYNLLFCLTTLFNYNDTKRFIEFIEYYINFGVDKFIVYNTNCSKNIEIIYNYYKMLGLMDIIYDNFTHNLYEKKRFHLWKHNDCFHKFKYSAKRIIYTDHDEIIYSPSYINSKSLFSHLNFDASAYLFYPKLIITHGKGFFISGNYSICPNKIWKYVINKPNCIIQVSIHFVINKRNCYTENINVNVAFVIHARNEISYHAKACKKWIYENNYTQQQNLITNITHIIEKEIIEYYNL